MRTMILASAPSGTPSPSPLEVRSSDGGVVGVGLRGLAPALGPGLAEELVGPVADGVVDPRHLGDRAADSCRCPVTPSASVQTRQDRLACARRWAASGSAPRGRGCGGTRPGAPASDPSLPWSSRRRSRPRVGGGRTGDRLGLLRGQLAAGAQPRRRSGGPRAAGPSRPAAPHRPWTCRSGGPATPRPCGPRRPATPWTPRPGRRPGS